MVRSSGRSCCLLTDAPPSRPAESCRSGLVLSDSQVLAGPDVGLAAVSKAGLQVEGRPTKTPNQQHLISSVTRPGSRRLGSCLTRLRLKVNRGVAVVPRGVLAQEEVRGSGLVTMEMLAPLLSVIFFFIRSHGGGDTGRGGT